MILPPRPDKGNSRDIAGVGMMEGSVLLPRTRDSASDAPPPARDLFDPRGGLILRLDSPLLGIQSGDPFERVRVEHFRRARRVALVPVAGVHERILVPHFLSFRQNRAPLHDSCSWKESPQRVTLALIVHPSVAIDKFNYLLSCFFSMILEITAVAINTSPSEPVIHSGNST